MAEPAAHAGPAPNPERIFNTFNAYQQTAALKGAIELDLFTAIGEGNDTPETIAKRCQASVRGVRILCDFLVVHGLLEKQDGHYRLTRDTAVFLDRRSPAYIGSAVTFINAPEHIDSFRDVAGIVRKGGTLRQDSAVEPDHPMWVEFARSMAPLTGRSAESIAGLIGAQSAPAWKVLDIASSHGLFGIEIAKRNPQAQIVAVDWPNVLAFGEDNARKAGVHDRYRKLPGSAFEVDFGSDYDVVLITNFLHHFDKATCQQFLGKVHRALKTGGRAVTLEFVPNEDRVSPPAAAAFSMMMLALTPGGDAYTFSEFEQMFQAAGFKRNDLKPLPLMPQHVVISYK
jgi:2-polyprenyl-3-methyl-5-hydroxy-6-metoxy-1,4-benzoquinol methylase